MTTEQKVKAYDEALEKARIFKEHLIEINQKDFADEMEYIFPELTESDDEKIRKALLEYFGEECDTSTINGIYCYKIYDWFEKQGKNPIDKIEPRFKVGDWITDGQLTCKILGITGKSYELHLYNDDNCHFETDIQSVDKHYHLWNIKDAKKGDVIYLPNGNNEYYFFIFKGIENAAVMTFAHFYQYNDGTSKVEGTIDKLFSVNDVFQPATKEQHDILFAKMKEAGYEWDEGKKELRKIVAPKFNIHDCVVKKHNSNINDFGYFIITDITGGKYWFNDRIICDITEQDEWELYEPVRQNYAAWSEEDEKIREALIKGFNECIVSSSHYPENAVKYWHGIAIDNILAWLEKQKSIDILDAEERVFADNVNAFREEIDNAYQKGFDEKVKTAERNKNEDSSRSDQIRDEAQKWECCSGDQGFIEGVKWSGENPIRELWDKEKVIYLLKRMIWDITYEDLEGNSTEHYDKMEFIEDLTKAMEE